MITKYLSILTGYTTEIEIKYKSLCLKYYFTIMSASLNSNAMLLPNNALWLCWCLTLEATQFCVFRLPCLDKPSSQFYLFQIKRRKHMRESRKINNSKGARRISQLILVRAAWDIFAKLDLQESEARVGIDAGPKAGAEKQGKKGRQTAAKDNSARLGIHNSAHQTTCFTSRLPAICERACIFANVPPGSSVLARGALWVFAREREDGDN